MNWPIRLPIVFSLLILTIIDILLLSYTQICLQYIIGSVGTSSWKLFFLHFKANALTLSRRVAQYCVVEDSIMLKTLLSLLYQGNISNAPPLLDNISLQLIRSGNYEQMAVCNLSSKSHLFQGLKFHWNLEIYLLGFKPCFSCRLYINS